jgi:hypothetical protein
MALNSKESFPTIAFGQSSRFNDEFSVQPGVEWFFL